MIPKTFEEAFSQTTKLVEQFEQNESKFLKDSSYQEANVRQDYLDKFFVALGWDVYHNEQTNPYEREVHIERSINVQGRGKRADYAFFVAPDFQQTRWIAEAKKPIHNLENKDYCFQTLRYGWNSNTPLAILTDFDRFFILDSRYKPSIETAIDRIHKRFHYKDFADEEKFREIYYLFSREAVADGAIEKYAQSLKKGRGVRQTKLFNTGIIQPVDDEFLSELDEQRGELARAFKNRNPQLDGEALTEITQRTLDRLVFIRFLEDKLVEPSEIIDKLGKQSNSAWQDFVAESRRLDKIYNGIIFKEHTILDAPGFAPDEKTFEDIRDWLSHKNSPYDFNTIPIHILGSAYERFLGKTIVATEKRAKVEEKPEVRKAGGVYYTPEYIVRYIVQNTIGKLIEGKTPEEIAEMRFADIACGSGSFLLGVFDYLIAYHVGYFDKNKNRRNNAIKNMQARETVDGTLQLTLGFKREILLANIYGVDLDAQAVEVAQLSLYLKLLEEETTATAQQYLAGLREQMLPSLNKNIVHGNSLISFSNFDLFTQYDSEEMRKLNLMDFESSFPNIFARGDKGKRGFDAIVGNPPYVRQELLGDVKPYFKKHYETYHGVADLYVYFFEQYIKLLKDGGEFGIIVANKWLRANYGEPLRRWLKGFEIKEIIDFGDLPVFQGATTYPCIVIVRKSDEETESFDSMEVKSLDFGNRTLTEIVSENKFEVKKEYLNDSGWSLSSKNTQELLNKLSKTGVSLGEYVDGKIHYGIKTGFNEAFVIDGETKHSLIAEDAKSAELIKPFLAGRDIKRYKKPQAEKFLIFTRRGTSISKYPAIENYLTQFKTRLTPKPKDWKGKWNGRKGGSYKWFEIQDTVDYHAEFEKPKIIVPAIVKSASYAFDTNQNYSNDKTTIIQTEDFYLLGVISSKLLDFFIHSIASTKQGGYFEYKPMYIVQIPIRTIDFENRQDKERHDKLVGLVGQMLDAKLKLSGANTDKDKQFYERFCSSLDSNIDNLVYKLYELTDEEIAIVENG